MLPVLPGISVFLLIMVISLLHAGFLSRFIPPGQNNTGESSGSGGKKALTGLCDRWNSHRTLSRIHAYYHDYAPLFRPGTPGGLLIFIIFFSIAAVTGPFPLFYRSAGRHIYPALPALPRYVIPHPENGREAIPGDRPSTYRGCCSGMHNSQSGFPGGIFRCLSGFARGDTEAA